MLWDTNARAGVGLAQARKAYNSVTASDFFQWRDQSGLFDGLAVVSVTNAAHLGGATRLAFADVDPNAEPARVAIVSPAFFDITGVRPRIGRVFKPSERRASQPVVEQREPAVLLQDTYWRRRFQGREDIVGQTVWQDYGGGEWRQELLVAGVMPRRVRGCLRRRRLPPAVQHRAGTAAQDPLTARYFGVIGPTGRGLSLEEDLASRRYVSRVLEQRNPGRPAPLAGPARPGCGGRGRRIPHLHARAARRTCSCSCWCCAADAATLLLLKAMARAREIAVRSAMGASGGRLLRQFVDRKCPALALAGAAVGLALAHVLSRLAPSAPPQSETWAGLFWRRSPFASTGRSRSSPSRLRWSSGGAFGLLPAWHASRTDLVDSLKDAGPTVTGGPRRRRVTFGLILGAIRPRRDPGDRERPAPAERRRSAQAGSRIRARVEDRDWSLWNGHGLPAHHGGRRPHASRGRAGGLVIERGLLGGAESSSAGLCSSEWPHYRACSASPARPLPSCRASDWLARFQTESAAQEGAGEGIEGVFTSVDPDYFAEMRIRLLEGRTFGPDDRRGLPPVAVD